MPRLERFWDERNRTLVLTVSAAAVAIIAVVDWWTKPYLSLGFLYLFPIMLAAVFIPRWAVALLGAGCAVLAELFSSLAESPVRLGFETLALAGCGLFVGEIGRNRRLSLQSQQRLQALVETSPAAIVTVDEQGSIDLANRAAIDLLAPRTGRLIGAPIAAFLPELHHALEAGAEPRFRASMQCLCHRDNGEAFASEVWFSTYREGPAPQLAAIVADISDREAAGAPGPPGWERREPAALSERETEALRLLVQGLANKEIAARMGLSESAVKNTLRQMFGKTGVRTRSQLVRVALERYRELL